MYSRFGNPTIEIFQKKKMALLEGAEECWATSSGMSSLFTIFMSYLKKGDQVVSSKALFEVVTILFLKFCRDLGLKWIFVDGKNLNEWESALKKTDMVF